MVHIYQRGEIKTETNATTRKYSHYKGSSIYNIFTQGYESGFTSFHLNAHLQKIPYRLEGSGCVPCHSKCPLIQSIASHLAGDRPQLRQCSAPARLQRPPSFRSLTASLSSLKPTGVLGGCKHLTYLWVGRHRMYQVVLEGDSFYAGLPPPTNVTLLLPEPYSSFTF